MLLKGVPVSEGYALGKAWVYKKTEINVDEKEIDSSAVSEHIEKYKNALNKAENELKNLENMLISRNDEKSKIFHAHIDILNDMAICEDIEDNISEELLDSAWAIKKVFDKYIRIIKKGKDETIRERADDLKDVRDRLLRCYFDIPDSSLGNIDEEIILLAYDLMPSDTAKLDKDKVLAIVTEVGGPTSHSAIIARSYGIPAILGVEKLMDMNLDGVEMTIDAINGIISTDPSEEEKSGITNLKEKFLKNRADTEKYLKHDCITLDGTKISINLNIGSGTKQELEASSFVDGIGLFRTEFLYMGRDELPSEQEQFEIYKKILSAYEGKSVTLRTIDIGGDKQTACIKQAHEDNPFLGKRALRLCFDNVDIFKTQLRAALRASEYGKLWLMLPMVGSIEDIENARAIVKETESELLSEYPGIKLDYKFGIMVEIPSIAIISDIAARKVDFGSIGSNDLCQYTLAVDRLNKDVSKYYDPFSIAVLRLIKSVVDAYNNEQKPISVCGEMGGDVLSSIILVGFGMRKLSMGLSSVAKVKKILCNVSIAETEELSNKVLMCETADDARELVKSFLISKNLLEV